MSLTCAHRSAAEVCSNTVRRRLLGGNGNGLVKAGIPEAARPGRYPDPEPGARRGPGRSVTPEGWHAPAPDPEQGRVGPSRHFPRATGGAARVCGCRSAG